MSQHSEERNVDAPTPTWVHRNKGRNRAERRAVARQKKVLPPPALNRPYEKEES